MIQRLWVPGPLPGLNEILDAKGNQFSKNYSAWTKLKQQWHGRVKSCASEQKIQPVTAAWFRYSFHEQSRRRDPSNFIGGGIKIIEDGLQAANLLAGDGWKNVLSIVTQWEVDADNPGVLVEMESDDAPDV